jgi:peroxiredoxin (alkyl hydroperoxide reductase subunit C)
LTVRVGSQVPGIPVQAYVRGDDGPREVDLAKARGRWVVLFFYPRDFTFVCPTELRAFADLEHDFANEGAVVLGASTDSWHVHKAWFEGDPRLHGVAYPVLADTSHALSAALGVLNDDGAALRATFVIDPDGIVRHASVNDLDVGRNVEETLRLVRAFKTGHLCPVAWKRGDPTLTEQLAALARAADQAFAAEAAD